MKNLILVVIASCLFITEIHAQFTCYIIQLKDKSGNPFSLSTPSAYLSQRAIDRRTRYGIAIDSTDLPVTPSYITQIRNVPNTTVLNVSKWHNSIAIQTSDPNAITTINGLSFVQSVTPIAAQTQNDNAKKLIIADQPYNPIGDIFVKQDLADTIGLFCRGATSTYSIVGNALHIDGTAGYGDNYIKVDSFKTSLDVAEIEVAFVVNAIDGLLTGPSLGIANPTMGRFSSLLRFSTQFGGNLGKLYLYTSNGLGETLLTETSTGIAVDIGDTVIVKWSAYQSTVTALARNKTQDGEWLRLPYTYTNLETKMSGGWVTMGTSACDINLLSLKYSSQQIKEPDVYLFGDSKFTKSTYQNESIPALFKNNEGFVVANSACGDDLSDLIANEWEVINQVRPKKILIENSNSIRYGVPSATWQAQINQLYNDFTNAGIDVYFTAFYETSSSQAPMDTWLAANYPLKYIRLPYTDLANNTGVLLPDNIHLTAFGNRVAHDAIVNAGLLETTTEVTDFFKYGKGSLAEINLHKGRFLHNIGLRGQGMVIAMLDGGFSNYNTLDGLDSIIINNQVLDTWDFYSKNSTVADDHPHGMQSLSVIAANIPGQFIGKAPKANFMLYRTEDAFSEYPIEEFNMVCGMERADSAGADVIATSLGYSEFNDASFNHSYTQLNGNTTIAATGADLAAKKGMLFVVAAGNEGNSPWHYIMTPADGDSVLAIGAVDANGVAGSFSGYGPSGDAQVKPDVVSVGVNVMAQSTGNTIVTGSETSFACSNMAGLSTILWQAFPEANNMRIVRALREAGSVATSPDNRIGYGIPDLESAFETLLIEFATSTSTIDTCTATVRWISKDVSAMKYEIERKLPGEFVYTKVGELFPQPGNVLAIHNYQFSNTIVSSPTGSVLYRIRQIIDTTFVSFKAAYIDTTAVSISSGCFTNFLASAATSSATISNCTATINWYSKDNGAMKYEIDRKLPDEAGFSKIAEVPAQPGTGLSWHNYSFNNTIINSPSGVITYRIRQIIDTVSASFLGVYLQNVTVNISDQCFPNYLISTATSSTTISGCSVTVHWSSTDYGAMKYEIERKAPGETDFSKIGELAPTAGVSLANHSYEFVNSLPTGSSGSFSYRIRQIIDTTTAKFTAVYIDTTNANLLSSCITLRKNVEVRPNPSIGNTTTLIIETTDEVPSMPILVFNIDGRQVQRLQESKGPGKKIIDLSVAKLPQGKYYINVYNKNVLIGTAIFIKL